MSAADRSLPHEPWQHRTPGRHLPVEHRDAERLAALARECRTSGVARRVLLLRLSSLPQHWARPHHLRLARDALLPLTAVDRARLYRLPNEDLAVAWRGQAAAALQESLDAIRYLFTDDTGLAADPGSLATVLELPAQADTLLDRIADMLAPRALVATPAPRGTAPLDTATLAALETALAQASVDRFARRDPVCAAAGDGRFVLCWERRHLSVAELFEALAPARAPTADPWLFLRLTRALDRRMLTLLATPAELRQAAPFSLDLNVASILAAEFLRFDTALPAAMRGHVVLNLCGEDMLADPAAFLFARDFARARGYRLLLRGITAERLALFPRRRSGLDLLQLHWSPALAAAGVEALLPEADTVVLSGADTADAVAWGRAHRVRLYQGNLAAPNHRPPPMG
jgi:hypothetical protein